MSYCSRLDPGKVARWKSNIAAGVKRAARRCPACKRGNGLGAAVHFPGGWVRRCRYCGHEAGGLVRMGA